LRFTVYVNESAQQLRIDGSPSGGHGCRPADLTLRINTNDKFAGVISRCEFRPWTEADSALLRWPSPARKVECRAEETALSVHLANFGLAEKPDLAAAKPYLVATTGTTMQWISPGKFDHPNMVDRNTPAKPTEITLTRGFWIGRSEVSQAEWSALMPANPSRVVGSPFLPVEGVSWEDAGRWCALLTEQEMRGRRLPNGYAYRLPTSAEWEYACRAGTGADIPVDAVDYWHRNNSGFHAHEVGQGKANAWGLYDMHGNVPEWCLDAFQDPPQVPIGRLTDPVALTQNPKD
jgi:formylglycine-generating enzyme required for sulfatase activity